MPLLDPKGEIIVAAYLANGGNQSESWKAAHPNSRAKPQSIAVEASKFFAKPNVRLRIVELQAKVEANVLLTLEGHMKELEILRDLAKARNQTSAAVAAEVKRGELMGYYVERRESTNTNYNITDKPLSEDEWKDKYGVGAPGGAANRPH